MVGCAEKNRVASDENNTNIFSKWFNGERLVPKMGAKQKLVDYFVISGLDVTSGLEPDQLLGESLHVPPLDRPYKPRILSHYPEDVAHNPFDAAAVCMLCYPRGIRFRTQRDKHKLTNFHPFLITREDRSRIYGGALTFFEEVDNPQIISAMQTLQAMHLAELSNAQSRTLYSHLQGSVYKRSPHLHKKQDVKTKERVYNPSTDRLYVSKVVCIISQLPLNSLFKQILQALLDVALSPDEPTMPLESYIHNLIYEVPLPPPGRSMRFSHAGQTLTCQRPSGTELPLLDVSLRETLLLLGVKNVLDVFNSVLLEHQVLFYSKDYGRLMQVAEGITALLFPFQWQHTYVPILPASLLHFLDAPVPFIMGVHHITDDTYLLNVCSQANLCFVDVDHGRVDLPEDLPVFPHKQSLLDDVEHRLTQLQSGALKQNGHERDSGFRDSYTGGEDLGTMGTHSTEVSASSSLWNIPNKMEILQQSETLAKITALAKKTGVISSLEDISDSLNDDIFRTQGPVQKPPLSDRVKDLIFSTGVREIFLHYFMQIFSNFEAFVIQPTGQDMDAWLSTRETMHNFDKAAFLSDQPEAHLPFLSAFLESQMFTSFIDNKIIAQWEEADPFLQIFEARVRRFKENHGDHSMHSMHKYLKTSSVKEAENHIEKRANNLDLSAPPPRQIEGLSHKHQAGRFPPLSKQILFRDPNSNKTKREGARWRKKDRLQQHTEHLQLSSDQREKYIQEARSKGLHQPKLSQMDPSTMAQTNWKFVETLLKEVKAKTKKMLVQKMGQEAVELGHGEATLSGVEENTLIASLCELLERIWSHGIQTKKGKSSLWSHLLSFQEADQVSLTSSTSSSLATEGSITGSTTSNNSAPNPNLLTPDLASIALEGEPCPSGTQTWPIRRHRRKPSKGPELPVLSPLPISVAFDVKNVQNMKDIKSEVGCMRAWVRLSLEKKLLSRHLKELLSKPDLLKSLYKRYAFLRCEDEREQFLFHLLSLNAVDYHCFTNTFLKTDIPYRFVLFPRQKIGGNTTTANCWLCLAGHLGETGTIPIPKNTLDLSVKKKNLGTLTTLRIGHDNAGMSPKWMVEHILVRNEVTSRTYRFPCGRWLGRGVDDGSLERLLFAEAVSSCTDHSELMEKCRTPPRCRSPSMPRRSSESKLQVSEIQEMLGDAVNSLVKHFYKPEKERRSGSVTGFLCGEYGLVFCMEHVFQCGFKSSRLFRNRFFIWDFFEKVQNYFETLLMDTEHFVIAEDVRTTMESFSHVVSRIDNSSEALGKDGKFQIFVCIGVRDQWLQRWIRIISKTPVTANMYEERAFLRDPALVQFLIQILDSLKDFPIKLESSLIRGIEL